MPLPPPLALDNVEPVAKQPVDEEAVDEEAVDEEAGPYTRSHFITPTCALMSDLSSIRTRESVVKSLKLNTGMNECGPWLVLVEKEMALVYDSGVSDEEAQKLIDEQENIPCLR